MRGGAVLNLIISQKLHRCQNQLMSAQAKQFVSSLQRLLTGLSLCGLDLGIFVDGRGTVCENCSTWVKLKGPETRLHCGCRGGSALVVDAGGGNGCSGIVLGGPQPTTQKSVAFPVHQSIKGRLVRRCGHRCPATHDETSQNRRPMVSFPLGLQCWKITVATLISVTTIVPESVFFNSQNERYYRFDGNAVLRVVNMFEQMPTMAETRPF